MACAALFVALAALAPWALAEGCSRQLTVAASPVGRAMMVGADGKITGAAKDFLDKISLDTGCSFDYKQVPRARAWMLLATGKVDIVPAAAQSAERDEQAWFVPTHRLKLAFVTLDAKLPLLYSTSELRTSALHIGVVRGYHFGPAYANLVKHLRHHGKLHEVADPAGIVNLLATRRIDAAIVPLSALADAMEDARMGQLILSTTLADMAPVQIGFYLSSSSMSLADRTILRAAFRRTAQDGGYRRFMQRHYPAWSLADIVTD